MTRKTTAALAVAAGLILAAGSALAQDDMIPGEITGSVAFTTDYVFRGVSQTDEHAAVQASLNYGYEGFYVGAWGSNVDFDDGDEATAEVDLYGGYAGEVAGVGYDLGFIYYWYPGADDALNFDFWELKGALSYSIAPAMLNGAEIGLGTQVYYSPEFFGETGDAVFWTGTLGVSFPIGVGIDGAIGHQWVDDAPDYLTWNVGGNYTIKGVKLDVRYHGTDEDALGDLGEDRVVFTASYAF